MNFVKVGALFINLEEVAEIRDTGVDLEVFFRGSERATVLRGSEAERLRRWLEAHATDLNDMG